MQGFISIRYSLKKVNMNLLNIRKEEPVFINVEVKDTTLLFMHQITNQNCLVIKAEDRMMNIHEKSAFWNRNRNDRFNKKKRCFDYC